MRPLLLEMSAFGSYPEVETIDFTLLEPRGLFVVTGDTGAGKSTIFDAMCFALFGEMPGKPANDIRSHHAHPETETFVRFRFEVGGEEFIVEQSPPYQGKKLRGDGFTKKNAEASLVRIGSDGSSNSVASSVKQVKLACERLIGLSADQFQKVLLLPQGGFQKFLLEGSSEREEILSQLFNGRLYEDVIEHLKTQKTRLDGLVEADDLRIAAELNSARVELVNLYGHLEMDWSEDDNDADRDRLGHLFQETVDPIEYLASRQSSAAEAEKAAQMKRATADEMARKFDDALDRRNQLRILESSQSAVDSREAQAQLSVKAREVLGTHEALVTAEAAHRKAVEALEDRRQSILREWACFDEVLDTTSAQSIVETMGRMRGVVDSQNSILDALQNAKTRVAGLKEDIRRIESKLLLERDEEKGLTERLNKLGQRKDPDVLQGRLDSIERALEVLPRRAQLVEAIVELEVEAETANGVYEALFAQFLTSEAPRLAKNLRSGEPCPVCGSGSHPAPASIESSEIVEYASITAAKSHFEELKAGLDEKKNAIRDMDIELGDLRDKTVADVELSKAEVELDLGRVAEFDALTEKIGLTSQAIARLEGEKKTKQDDLGGAEENEKTATENATGIDEASVLSRASAIDNINGLLDGLTGLFDSESTTRSRMQDLEGDLKRALVDKGFARLENARGAVISEDLQSRWIAESNEHKEKLIGARAALGQLEKEGIPDIRPDTEAAHSEWQECHSLATDLASRLTLATDVTERVQTALSEHDSVAKDSVTLRGEALRMRRAFEVCNGRGQERINLTRWVLARELDRITDAASVRLQKMTNGRYSLRRKMEISDKRSAAGLDIEVFDSHTGRSRVPRSLSGGEQFQASLALALGLADVVSRGGTGSGKRSHALFIDEGFGSLDPRALDDVIETLQQLQATGRMVGAITHVPEMKERLHQGIIVSERPDGRGSTLHVNP